MKLKLKLKLKLRLRLRLKLRLRLGLKLGPNVRYESLDLIYQLRPLDLASLL